MQPVNNWVACDGITTLSTCEMDNPVNVLKVFCADFSLLAMKELFSTMTDLCVMAEDVCAAKATARQGLFSLSARMAKLLEAVYLIARKDDAIIEEDGANEDMQAFRRVRVYRSRGSGERPLLTFNGNWLYMAGFHIGDEVQIAIEPGRLILTVSRQWSRTRQQWRVRA